MSNNSYLEWTALVSIAGTWGYQQDSKKYTVFKDDGNRRFFTTLFISDIETEGSAAKDFYDNYKPSIDAGKYKLEPRSDDGVPIVYGTRRPLEGYTNYFTGAGDNGGIGNGQKIIFNLLSTDASKSVDLVFSEAVYLKDGYIQYKGAPLGAHINLEIIHPQAGLLSRFVNKFPIFGDNIFSFITDDRGLIPQGLIIRVSAFNSTGADGEDAACAFKASGSIKIFRVTTK